MIEVDDQISKPLNLANSAVLRAVEEEEQAKSGYKRVAWPPVSEERIIREFTPQPQNQQSSGQGQLYSPQHLQSNVSASQQQQLTATVDQQQQQASGAAIATPTAATQPQQQQQQPFLQSQDQLDRQQSIQPQLSDYRGVSPGIITLRNEAPVTQKPAPVYTSQPAAVSYQGGTNMRGDLKWPPQEYKEAADRENEERRKLALGPVCRPRRVNRDYASFFAKNAISHHYPSYRVPPGTQHMLA